MRKIAAAVTLLSLTVGTILPTHANAFNLTPNTAITAKGKPNSVNDYKFLAGVNPRNAWRACKPIGYRINLNGAKTVEKQRIREAFNRIEKVTQLNFKYEGTTNILPLRNGYRNNTDPRTNITIGFAKAGSKPNEAPLFKKGTILGMTSFPEYGFAELPDGKTMDFINRTGTIYNLDRIYSLPEKARLALYMHEFAHAIGLNHAEGNQQILYPYIYKTTKPQWGKGDLTGLARLGNRTDGCTV